MEDVATFVTVITRAVGMTQNRQRNAITLYGFTTCVGLMTTKESNLRSLLDTIERSNRGVAQNQQVRINMSMRSNLFALREEFLMRDKCNAAYTLADLIQLNAADMARLGAKHRTWEEAKKAAKSMSLPDITVPALTKLNWKEFNRAFLEVLTRQRGMNDVPFTYVIREMVINDYNAAFESTEKQLIACLNHIGQKYTADRESVYSLLVQYVKGSEAESIVDQCQSTRNGRAAYRAILNHMQSTSYMDNLRTSAIARIQSAKYKGEKKDFGIVKFFTIHSNAHNDLETAGESMTDGMKITNFLNGIEDTVAISYAITTKSEPGVTTFEQFYNSFSAKLTSHITLTKTTGSQRNINAVYGDSGGKGRGRGRGRGRGGRGGRHGLRKGGRGNQGGRGRGGGNNRYNPYDSSSSNWHAENKNYSTEDWQALTSEQKSRVRDLRAAMNSSQQGGSDQRQVNAASTSGGGSNTNEGGSSADVPSQISVNEGSVSSSQGRAGDAFRRGGNSRN
jgi:hypothetical protein